MNRPIRYILLTFFALLVAIILMNSLGSGLSPFGGPEPVKLSETAFLEKAQSGSIKKAAWQGSNITGKDVGGRDFTVVSANIDTNPENPLHKNLQDIKGFDLEIKTPAISQTMFSILSVLALPLMIFALLYFFVLRPAQNGGNQALSFGRSRAKRVGDAGPKVTFDDVAGMTRPNKSSGRSSTS